MATLTRIGILTGGGDCPGLNAVIRAVTKTALLEHGLEVVGIFDGMLGLIENRMRVLSLSDVSNILATGGTILGTSNKANPSRFFVGSDPDGTPVFKDVTDQVVEHVRRNELHGLVCIGGDGTMSCAKALIDRGINCVGVPKTIDNDLLETDVTFGFDTAVQTACEALDRIHTTAASHHRVMLVELMGRNAGWLTLHAGVASGADVILIPEIPYDLQVICNFCKERMSKGKRSTIVAVAEGAAPLGGKQVVDRLVHDSFDAVRLGGVSEVLADHITRKTQLETRATILGHVQRGGSPSAFDRVLGTLFGSKAVELVARGLWNRLVVHRDGKVTTAPISAVAGRQRMVPPDSALIAAARGIGTIFGDQR